MRCAAYEKNHQLQYKLRFLLLLWFSPFLTGRISLPLTSIFKGTCIGHDAFFRPFGEDDVLASEGLPCCWLCRVVRRRGKPDVQKWSISFMRLFEAPKYMWWQADKNVLHAERRRVCLCLLVCSPFLKKVSPASRQLLGGWTRVAIDIRWVYKYNAAFEGELRFKNSPCPTAWWRGVGKGEPGTETGEE